MIYRTFGRNVLVCSFRPGNHLLATLLQGLVQGLQLLQIHRDRFVFPYLLPDLVHLHRDGRGLAQALGDPVQGFQHGVDLVVELVENKGRFLPTCICAARSR